MTVGTTTFVAGPSLIAAVVVLALITIYQITTRRRDQQRSQAALDKIRRCTSCGEVKGRSAARCRHCGATPAPAAPQAD